MLNVELLLRVKEDILANPDGFSMENPDKCIASRTLKVKGLPWSDLKTYQIISQASSLLGLNERQSRELFLIDWEITLWPPHLREIQFAGNLSSWQQAQLASQEIDHFISKYAPKARLEVAA